MKFDQGFKESSVAVVHFHKHTDFYKTLNITIQILSKVSKDHISQLHLFYKHFIYKNMKFEQDYQFGIFLRTIFLQEDIHRI